MPRSRLCALCLGAALTALSALPAAAADPALSPAQEQSVRDLVRRTLVENPEILAEALESLKAKRVAYQHQAQIQAIQAHQADLTARADDPVIGKKDAPIVIVEFFDYNCGYCRAAYPDIAAAIKANSDARVVIKDLPVLGEASLAVSRLALAARAQGRYTDFHAALMTHKGRLDEASALEIAKSLKLDVKRLQADAKGKAVEETIARNHLLAGALDISGTPTFIIGETLIPGRIDGEMLAAAISERRDAAKAKK